ncbi:hypothetical protein CC2G_012680 [Coprinopsis cinerea AmutBmut pab1-1]|nr:hypothetical protein CC2G_012680 [Coprinopsis cinerea AmutBmut pab1-1]
MPEVNGQIYHVQSLGSVVLALGMYPTPLLSSWGLAKGYETALCRPFRSLSICTIPLMLSFSSLFSNLHSRQLTALF